MNSHDPSFDEQIHHALVTRLDAVAASTDLTTAAIAQAGAIRRRRRTVAAASAALATVAIAAPFVWWNVQHSDVPPVPAVSSTNPTTVTSVPSTTSPIPSTSTSGTPTSPPAPRTIPTGDADAPQVRVTVNPDAPLVPRAGLPYVLDTTLHRGGTTQTFDVKAGFSYLPLARGRSLLIERGPGGQGYDLAKIVDAGGNLVAEIHAARGQYLFGKANDAGTLVALMDSSMQGSEPTATLSVFDEAGAPLHQKRNVLSNVRIAGFVGNRVFIGNSEVGRSYVWDLDRNSIDRYTDEGVVTAVNEATGRAAFYFGPGREEAEATDAFGHRCTEVSDVRGTAPVPISASCGKFFPTELSPDGRYLLGVVPPADGMMQGPSRVIDVATGRAVVALDEDRPLDIDSGFLPDGSVVLNLILAPDGGDTRNTLMRCALDGACTRMVPTIEIPDFGRTMAPRYQVVGK